MNVLFVLPINARPSMGVMLLSAVLRQAGHRTAAVDLALPLVQRALARRRVDVVALSYPTTFAAAACAVARAIRPRFAGLILAGGPHATLHAGRVAGEAAIDGVCAGEGEEALLAALEAHARGLPLAGLPGWWARSGGAIVRGPRLPPWLDLDRLPFADRDLLLPHPVFGDRVQPFAFSRGCPFRCTYCLEPAFRRLHGPGVPAVRRRSVGSAMAELLRVKQERDVRLNLLYDDTLNADRPWLLAFCEAYREQVALPFHCKVRPDLLDRESARALAGAGCRIVFMGVESGNPAVREHVLGRAVDDEAMIRAARLVRQQGMKLVTYNLAGIPGTSWRDDLMTLDLNRACRPDATMVLLLQPYAGTPMHATAVRAGMWRAEDDARLERAGHGVNERSLLRWADRGERRRVHNLRSLFGLTLALPGLRPLIPWLVALPAGPLYARLGGLWFFRAYHRVLYPTLAHLPVLAARALAARLPGRALWGRLPALFGAGGRAWERGG